MHVGVGLPEEEAKATTVLLRAADVREAVPRAVDAVRGRRAHVAARLRVAETRDMAATPERIMVGNRDRRVRT